MEISLIAFGYISGNSFFCPYLTDQDENLGIKSYFFPCLIDQYNLGNKSYFFPCLTDA